MALAWSLVVASGAWRCGRAPQNSSKLSARFLSPSAAANSPAAAVRLPRYRLAESGTRVLTESLKSDVPVFPGEKKGSGVGASSSSQLSFLREALTPRCFGVALPRPMSTGSLASTCASRRVARRTGEPALCSRQQTTREI